jgi:hypothetical protein
MPCMYSSRAFDHVSVDIEVALLVSAEGPLPASGGGPVGLDADDVHIVLGFTSNNS